MTSIRVWVNDRRQATALGFAAIADASCSYVEFHDNPFNPSSRMHSLPAHLVEEVTLRHRISSKAPLGRYFTDQAEMRVYPYYETKTETTGFFALQRKVPKEGVREIDMRAKSLPAMLDLFLKFDSGVLEPDPNYPPLTMQKLDQSAA
jgi:hypothetical protein